MFHFSKIQNQTFAILIFADKMKLNLLERSELNVEQWNALVNGTADVSFFSYAWYLDEVAENWCVFVDENYTIGIAIPYTLRFGKRIAYTPIFLSYLEVLGTESIISDEFENQLLSHFAIVEISVKTSIFEPFTEEFVTQILPVEMEQKLTSQAKRMLKKAKSKELEMKVSHNFEEVYRWVEQELKGKFTGMTEASLPRLKELFVQAKKRNQLITFEVWCEGQCEGGIVCLLKSDQLFYLKGVCSELTKKNGGMYLALQSAIDYAKEHQLLFDFGGSRVEGVRAFNKNLGGVDFFYYFYRIDKSPFWFKWLRNINARIKNR